MAFGKRSAGEGPVGRPPSGETPAPAEAPVEAPEAAAADSAAPTPMPAVRTRVANPGDIDRNFIALAVGVVVVSAGGAIAAPSLVSAFTGANIRPIEQVIAGLDRNGIEQALAREAFPDEAGSVFMTSLAASFPREHERLLDRLADAATAGSDRDGLFLAANAWSADFIVQNMPAISRTGADGFNRAVSVVTDGLRVVEARTGGCTGPDLQRFMADPAMLDSFTQYNSDGYRVSMRAAQAVVELAAKGRNAPAPDAKLNANDMNTLRAKFMSLMADNQVQSLMRAASASGGMTPEIADKINVCQLSRAVLIKLDELPEDTKARLWSVAMTTDVSAFLGQSGFAAPFGGGMQGFDPGAINFR